MKGLSTLFISNNRLITIENIIKSLSNTNILFKIDEMDFSANLIQNLNMAFSTFFSSLKKLYFDKNPINYIHEKCFENLNDIQNISLNECPITIHRNTFSNNSNLEFIFLNKISGKSLQSCVLATLIYINCIFLNLLKKFIQSLKKKVNFKLFYIISS